MIKQPLILSVVVALAGFLPQSKAALMVDLASASSFAVLAGSGITVAGAVNSTTITGDIGTFPTTSITGFGNVVLNGVNHAGDGVTQGAKTDLVTAYNAASQTVVFDVPTELGGGLAKLPGVYANSAAGTFGITGTLTLDAGGDPNAVWLFLASSTLITASSSSVVFLNGIGDSCNVFWQIGSSATLGTDSSFVGTIMALTSITATTGATVDGRLLARNGAVTLDNNTIDATCVPEASTVLAGALMLLPFGASILQTLRKRRMP